MLAVNNPRYLARPGFTLVEVLIISPLVILVVAVIVAFMINMTGDALQTRERNNLIYSTQAGLDQIEMDVRLATRVVDTTASIMNPLAAGQGSDANFSGTAPFVSGNSVLVLEQYSTTLTPYDPNRSLLYYANDPNPCGSQQRFNQPVKHMAVFFLHNNTLKRRTIVNFGDKTVCGLADNNPNGPGIWQRNSCNITNTARCFTVDTVIADNVGSVMFQYYNDSATTTTSPVSISTQSVRITINSTKPVAGDNVTHSGSVRASRIQ